MGAGVHIVALLFALAPARPAHAAGHSIADANSVFGSAPTAIEKALPYRGAIGRIDTAIARAAIPKKRGGFPTEHVTVGADRACGSPTLDAGSADAYVVSLVFPPSPARPNDPSIAIVMAAPELHERIRGQAAKSTSRIRLLGVHGNAGVAVIPRNETGGDNRLRIEYPDVVRVSFDGQTPITGPARIVVTRANERIAFSKLAQSCRTTVSDDGFHPLVCVDELFFDEINRCGMGRADVHPGVCHFVGGGKRMNYADHCYPGQGASTHPAKCKGNPSELDYIVTSPCRSVLMEFSWREILSAGNQLVKRRIRATTSLSATGDASDGPVRIPGREFLGVYSPQEGKSAGATEFNSIKQAANADSLTLEGNADQSESTLLFYPRRIVGRVCGDGLRKGQACAGLENNEAVCARDPIAASECSCESLEPAAARYFSCKNSRELDDLPCTRASHCWSGRSKIGDCSGRPRCLPLGTVWEPGSEPEGTQCGLDSDCPAAMQCGYALFDLNGRSDHPANEIPAEVALTSKQRGNCSRLTSKICGGNEGLCSAREGKCLGYRAQAHAALTGNHGGDLDFPAELFHKEVPPGIVIGPGGVPDEAYGELKDLERAAKEGEQFY